MLPPHSRATAAILEGWAVRGRSRGTQEHDAYRWMCGGVGVNYHTLSDFRTEQEALFETADRQRGGVAFGEGGQAQAGGAGRHAGAGQCRCVVFSAARGPGAVSGRGQRGKSLAICHFGDRLPA